MTGRMLVERPSPRDGEERGRRGRGRLAARGKQAPARTVTVNLAESPLAWLKTRGHISARQYEAGEMLRTAWESAAMGPRVTMRWDAAAPPDKNARGAPDMPAPTLRQMAARRRFDAAMKAAGPGFADILWRVVCAGDGMREAERALGWPARAGKLVLGFALDRLADHYRLK